MNYPSKWTATNSLIMFWLFLIHIYKFTEVHTGKNSYTGASFIKILRVIPPAYLTLCVLKPEWFWMTRSISLLLMAWLLVSPGHQQLWYWLCWINISLTSIRNAFERLLKQRWEIKNVDIFSCYLNIKSAWQELKHDQQQVNPCSHKFQ